MNVIRSNSFQLDWIVTHDLKGIADMVTSFLPLAAADRLHE